MQNIEKESESDDNNNDDDDERDRDHSLYYIKLPMDLDPLLSKSQGFLTELVSPLSSEQIKMPAASESEITYE